MNFFLTNFKEKYTLYTDFLFSGCPGFGASSYGFESHRGKWSGKEPVGVGRKKDKQRASLLVATKAKELYYENNPLYNKNHPGNIGQVRKKS